MLLELAQPFTINPPAISGPLGGRDAAGVRRRGLPQGMEDSPSGQIIKAEVPLAEMFGYATDLRSATQGRASYSMEFLKYAEAPNSVAQAVGN